MTAETGGYRAAQGVSGSEALCALVLGGAPIVRAGVAHLLQKEYAGRARIVTAEWPARERALADLGAQPDVLVAWADADMPIEACARFASAYRGAGAIIVGPDTASKAPVAHAREGVVSLAFDAPLALWREALRVAAKRRARHRAGPPAAGAPAPITALTGRQHEVLEMLSMGLSNKHIARELELSVGTVKLHVAAVLRAMQAKNRLNLIAKRVAELNAERASDDRLACAFCSRFPITAGPAAVARHAAKP